MSGYGGTTLNLANRTNRIRGKADIPWQHGQNKRADSDIEAKATVRDAP
jgi:hypothetical protein